jgi:signal transduction histidine kinase
MSILYNVLLKTGRKKCVFLLLLLLSANRFTNAQPLTACDSARKITNDLTPEQTIDQLHLASFHFSKFKDNQVDFGITGSNFYYILLKLNAASNKDDQWLSIDNTSLDSVAVYRVFANGERQLLYQGGNAMPYKNKLYNWHTAPVSISPIPSFYFVALKASEKNINVHYEILDKDALQLKYQAYDRVVYFYIGVASMILFVITVALFHFKKPEFAAYIGYILCFAGWVLAHYGRLFPLLYPRVPVLNEVVKPVSSLGACSFLILVLQLVFQQWLPQHSLISKVIRSVLFGLVVLISGMFLFLFPALLPAVKYWLVALWHIGLVISIILVVCIPVIFFHTGITAKIFSAAMVAVAVMAFIQVIATAGIVSSFFINEHGLTMGSLVEISIMAFGLFFSLLEQMKARETQVLALEQEQTETLKRLVSVQDHERKRIAADLHDNIGPLLAALKINFGRIVHTKDPALLNGVVVKTEGIIDDSIAEIRNVAHNLMPKGLSSNGLISTLKEYLDSIQQLYNKEIDFKHQVQSILSIELQTNLYRIICELVLNATRHSKASLISVEIKADSDTVMVNIADNGQGFLQANGDQKKSLGLQSAESRVLYLKGKFLLHTAKEKGTAIHIEIPLQFDEAHVDRF